MKKLLENKDTMKKSIKWILIAILFVALVVVYFVRPCGHDQENNRLEQSYKTKIDSIESIYKTLLTQHDKEAYEAFSRAQMSANRMEGEAIYWKDQFKREKAKNRVFTNQQTDSLLSLVE